ncbi:MAG TPA: Maf family protein [Gemmatimonadota bacterium]|nr:Maf family protein [Gemmatimonadota bacterium]
MTRLVLASGSPRRRDILAALGLAFDVRPPDVDESLRPGEGAAAAARRLAELKATAVEAEPGELVLAADTIVVLDGDLLGKPTGPGDATAMLGRLAGRSHEVITGLALRLGAETRSAAALTTVTFRSLDRAEIAAYVATCEPLDKAGAYGIQGFGSALVERIEGDFFNVMGLPVPALLSLLHDTGFRYLYGEIVPLGDVRRQAAEGSA